jgi:hypothetical protein
LLVALHMHCLRTAMRPSIVPRLTLAKILILM